MSRKVRGLPDIQSLQTVARPVVVARMCQGLRPAEAVVEARVVRVVRVVVIAVLARAELPVPPDQVAY